MSVTLLVSKLLMSRLVKLKQSWNIELMSVTLLVSKLLKSSDSKPVQASNIELMFSTLLVSILSKLIFLRLATSGVYDL